LRFSCGSPPVFCVRHLRSDPSIRIRSRALGRSETPSIPSKMTGGHEKAARDGNEHRIPAYIAYQAYQCADDHRDLCGAVAPCRPLHALARDCASRVILYSKRCFTHRAAPIENALRVSKSGNKRQHSWRVPSREIRHAATPCAPTGPCTPPLPLYAGFQPATAHPTKMWRAHQNPAASGNDVAAKSRPRHGGRRRGGARSWSPEGIKFRVVIYNHLLSNIAGYLTTARCCAVLWT
jgi:hypothetical protein